MEVTTRAATLYAYLTLIKRPDMHNVPVSLSDIGTFFGVTKAACHFAIHGLLEEGYITRQRSGRVFTYQITEKGDHFLTHGVQQ